MSFESLGLSVELLRALREKGYTQPTPIQQQAIPEILKGRDILAGAQTGTGKTAGFTLPLLERLQLQGAKKPGAPRALILTPTRELALQVFENVEAYSRYLPVRATVVFGGMNINPQIKKLRQGTDILVATPGRLLDHAQQSNVDLSHVEILVLDEADRMLDMGFIRDIRKILALLPVQRQNLLFSATYSNEIRKLSDGLLRQPAIIEVAKRNTTADRVLQVVHPVDRERKRELLSWLIGSNNWQQVLVFTRTKHGANKLARQLEQDGLRATAIHGNKSQGARTKALAEFKSGKARVLVATDIAARGIDIASLPHVINFDLPDVAEDYVHRIGRTGRAGQEGEAISIVSNDDIKRLKQIERLLGRKIRKHTFQGYEPNPETYVESSDRETSPKNSRKRPSHAKKGKPGNTSNNKHVAHKSSQAKRNSKTKGQDNRTRNVA